MKNLVLIILCATLLEFSVRAKKPYYYAGDTGIAVFSGDTLSVCDWTVLYDFFTVVKGDTLGLFKLIKMEGGFYKVVQIPDERINPSRGMYYSVEYGDDDALSDSITLRLHFPNISKNKGLNITLTCDETDYLPVGEQRNYECKIASGHSSFKCDIKPQVFQPFKAVTDKGLFLGKLAGCTTSLEIDTVKMDKVKSINIYFPYFTDSSFALYHVPDSYMKIVDNGFIWLGQLWEKRYFGVVYWL